jgi:hypothetical protein
MTIGSKNPANRIVVAAVGMLAATSIIVGAAVMVVMQDRLETATSSVLTNTLDSRSRLLDSLIEQYESRLLVLSSRPHLKLSLRSIAAGRDLVRATADVQTTLKSFLEAGFDGLAYLDADGHELARAGRFSEEALLSVRLATALESELAWTGQFIMRTNIAVSDGEGMLGTVIAEQPLPILTQLMASDGNYGKTGETALCFNKGEGMGCFPQRFNPRTFKLALYGQDGKALPMTHALWGENGLRKVRDYRGQQVIAAYGPVGLLGLGMVVKMDARAREAAGHCRGLCPADRRCGGADAPAGAADGAPAGGRRSGRAPHARAAQPRAGRIARHGMGNRCADRGNGA